MRKSDLFDFDQDFIEDFKEGMMAIIGLASAFVLVVLVFSS